MKKLFILLVSVLLFSFNCSAQSISSGNYKGYVDAGYSIGIGDYEFGRVEINTSHGYQFNPFRSRSWTTFHAVIRNKWYGYSIGCKRQ